MKRLPLIALSVILPVATALPLEAGVFGQCADFEDLPVPAAYTVVPLTPFSSQGVGMTPAAFVFSGGGVTTAGSATTQGGGSGPFSGIFLNVSNVNIDFDFGGTVAFVTLNYVDLDGNNNFSVNGDFRNVGSLMDLNGLTVGGAAVSVTGDTVTVTGTIVQFSIGGQEFAIDNVCTDDPVVLQGPCVEFEDLPVPATYPVGTTFFSDGVGFTVGEFFYYGGGSTTASDATTQSGGSGPFSGNFVNTPNVNLDMDFGGTVSAIRLNYIDTGGNNNLEVNGDFRNVLSLGSLSGTVVGGALVVVSGDTVRISGVITQFAIGGQEFSIDNVCTDEPVPFNGSCMDFEHVSPSGPFAPGDTFLDDMVLGRLAYFYPLMGPPTTTGVATVDSSQISGGSGLDMQLDNINLKVVFGATIPGVTFDFAELGGNVNLTVNGDLRVVGDFLDLDDLFVGGAEVHVIEDGQGNGRVRICGAIDTLLIGGQELWVDNICPGCHDCISFEEPPLGSQYQPGTSFTDSGQLVEVMPFGTVSNAALIGNSLTAGGKGQEVSLNNVNLFFDFEPNITGLSLLYGYYGGSVELEINSIKIYGTQPLDFDGLSVGGVQVEIVEVANLGSLTATGPIDTFAIGGQEFSVDDVCPFYSLEIFSDDFETGTTLLWSQTVP